MKQWSSDKVLVTIRKLSVDYQHIISCLSLHYAALCLTNVNINRPLLYFYGFRKVSVSE